MSSELELAAAELALAGALARLGRARSPEEQLVADEAVARAQQRLDEVKAAPAPQVRTCCELPMTWFNNRWICTRGHD